MGVVYRAHDERLDRDVALKVLPPGSLADADTRRRFKQEAQALAKLNHPNIATIYDFDCDGKTDFLVMELLSSQTLATKLIAGQLPANAVIKFGLQMAEGLRAAHHQGILHRDLKPGNLGLTTEGRLKILDFGLAKFLLSDPADVTRSMTAAGLARGTLAYMAPEQLRGEQIDTRVDLYAAGSVLYEMATGKRPHPQERGPLLIDAILNQEPVPPSRVNRSVSPALEAVILKALQKDPGQRYQSAQDLAADLEHLTAATTPVAAQQAARRRARKRLRPALAAACLLVLGLASWLGFRRLQFRPTTGERPTLLIGDFDNRTGESVFDSTLHEMFTSTLEQSHSVQVYPASRLADVLQRMGRPATQRIDESVGREICQREGIQGLLLGSIVKLGSKFVLLARIQAPSGSNIVTAQASASSADDVPARVDEIAGTLRRNLGESLQSLEQNSVPLAKVSSSSLDAVRYFTLGKQSLYNGDPPQAVQMFSKALELDPNFAMAHEYLGASYQHLNEYERGAEQVRLAAQLADRVSEPERLRIMAAYYASLLDFQKQCENYQLLIQLQPMDPAPYINLGVCKKDSLDYAAAVSSTEKALQFVPRSGVRINFASQLLMSGDAEKALQVAQPFSREYSNDLFAQTVLGRIYVALGRMEDARQIYKNMLQAGGDSEIEGELSLADLAFAAGQYSEGEKQLKAAIQAADKNHNRVSAAKARLALAEALLQQNAPPQAVRQMLAQVVVPPNTPALDLLLGRTYAWSGQLEAAGNSARPIDLLIDQHDVPALQALRYLMNGEIALAQRKFAEAVDAAQRAVAYRKSMFAVETLARCYAAAGMDQQAAQQYESLLTRANEFMDDSRAESFDEPAFRRAVEAQYRLAVLYQRMGRTGDARDQLQKFLGHWSQADANLGIYKDAQRLRSSLPASGVPTAAR
jgi:tetratricopeptide (TPR) repeat protein